MSKRIASLCSIALAFAASISQANADPVSNFYANKTVTILVGYSAGGGYDIYARAIARYLGRHIPGKPTVVVQNMPGAGSLVATNYLYNAALRDGTVLATFARGMAMQPLLDPAKTKFDTSKLTWLGSAANEVSVCATTKRSNIRTYDDMLKTSFNVSGEGGGSDPDTYAAVVRDLLGVKLKLVTGYPGAAEMTLAMERGEIDGRCGWSYSALKATRPDWLKDGTLNILLTMGLTRSELLPDVPSVLEKAKDERQREIMKLVFTRQLFARPFAMPPNVPADRVLAMRTAFMDTLRDPEFLEDAKRDGLEISPVQAEVVSKLVEELNATPKDVVEMTRKIVAAEP
jgi:tripartite-type tricarboxylate transporter receptor subunit TctC